MSEMLEQVLEMKARLDALPKPSFDCLVCLPDGYEEVKRASAKVNGTVSALGFPTDPLLGLAVYVCDNAVEVRDLVRKLEEEGKRPAVFGKELTFALSLPAMFSVPPAPFLADVGGGTDDFKLDHFSRKQIEDVRDRLWNVVAEKCADQPSAFRRPDDPEGA